MFPVGREGAGVHGQRVAADVVDRLMGTRRPGEVAAAPLDEIAGGEG